MRRELSENRVRLFEFLEIEARLDCPEERQGKSATALRGTEKMRQRDPKIPAQMQLDAEDLLLIGLEVRRLAC